MMNRNISTNFLFNSSVNYSIETAPPSSFQHTDNPPSYPVPLLISNVTISFLIILINTFVIFITLHRRVLLTHPSMWLLLSLSVCDVMRGIGIVLILTLETFFKSEKDMFALAYRIAVDVFNAFTIKSSVIHLCGVTLDRYLALSKTYSYKTIVTTLSVSRFLLGCWLFSFLASAVQLTWLYPVRDEQITLEMSQFDIWYSVVTFILFLAMPTVFIASLFVSIFIKIRHIMSRVIESTQININKASKQQLRILYSFFVMFLCFSVLVMPYFSLRLLIDVQLWRQEHIYINPNVYHFTFLLKNITSILNPMFYAGQSQQYRNESRRFVTECARCVIRAFQCHNKETKTKTEKIEMIVNESGYVNRVTQNKRPMVKMTSV